MSKVSIHADSDNAHIESAKRLLSQELIHATSKDKALSSKELAGRVGVKATTVRDIIKEIRVERDLPIVACSKGYYLIDSPEDLQKELERIDDEIETKEETKRELTKAFNVRNR